ncbi:peroxiredoxin-like family protein [Urechidicola vernalis]|uniref:thioredoxin-dependent peroxiredoxin n=1 Tax=Urechidicola vernalis TaxID=3075600 RepID=A0ABU2Y785_9FLAO|nr:peroxiredoxin-like family protein [Urechidicola sp. P050]MDT0554060.1 peroxiredoxin-like family protein [Urechidicola sp. P050]
MRHILTLSLFLSSFIINAQVFEDATQIEPLKIGATIPAVEVTSYLGKSKSISKIVSEQKTVLVFFRGGWCPYCNKHLAAVGAIQDQISELGYQVIAISPDSPEKLSENIDKNSLKYELYSDASTELMQAMGLAITAPERYSNMLLDFSDDKNSDVIPVPAVYILNTNGKVLYNYVNPNYKERLEEDELLEALNKFN